jgi:hypothetical protein
MECPQRKFLPQRKFPTTEEISAVRRGRGEKIVSDNSKSIRKSVGGLTSYFLHGGGMDVFWNDPINRHSGIPRCRDFAESAPNH